jgi:hypothetical protein
MKKYLKFNNSGIVVNLTIRNFLGAPLFIKGFSMVVRA